MMGLGNGGGVQWNKPAALMCHICGREYGTTSLKIHLPQCAAMWKKREALKPKSERRPVPKPAGEFSMGAVNPKDAASMEAFNNAQYKQFTEQSLVPCEHCGRRFNADRLPVHQRSCKPGNEAKPVGSHRIRPSNNMNPKQFIEESRGMGGGGGSSISPMKGSMPSFPYPSKSSFDDEPIGHSSNSIPTDASQPQDDLVPCNQCGRRFTADRIDKHENVCTKHAVAEAKRHAKIEKAGGHIGREEPILNTTKTAWKSKHEEFVNNIRYARKLAAMQKAGISLSSLPPPKPSENPDYVQCPHCSRRFNQNAAERHIPKCATTMNKPKPPPQLRGPNTAPGGGGARAQPQLTLRQQYDQEKKRALRAENASRPQTMAQGRSPGLGAPAETDYGYGDEMGYSNVPQPRQMMGRPRTQASRAGPVAAIPSPSAASSSIPRSRSSLPSTTPLSSTVEPPTPTLTRPASRGRPRSSSTGSASEGVIHGQSPSAGRRAVPASAKSPGGATTLAATSNERDELHSKIDQLTNVVQMLSERVLAQPVPMASNSPYQAPVMIPGRGPSLSRPGSMVSPISQAANPHALLNISPALLGSRSSLSQTISATPSSSRSLCGGCGAPRSASANFCPNCGARAS